MAVQKPVIEAAHHYGIQNLPDEVLAMTFLDVAEDEVEIPMKSFRRMISLASVNKRFRDIIVYRTPRCWSHVDLSHHMDRRVVDVLLERSRDVPLNICWDGKSSTFDLLQQLSIQVRCKSLVVENHYASNFAESENNNNETLLQTFPNLEKLRFVFVSGSPDDVRTEQILLSNWRLPNLRHLLASASGNIPSNMLSHLTTLELEGRESVIHNCLEDIRKAPSLLHLKLDLGFSSLFEAPQERVRTVNLTKLRTFKLMALFKAEDATAFPTQHQPMLAIHVGALTSALRMPALESMNIDFDDHTCYAGDGDVVTGVLDYLSFDKLFPVDEFGDLQMAPTNLFLNIETSPFNAHAVMHPYNPGPLIANYLSRFPSARSFTMSLSSDSMVAMREHCTKELARLRYLSIDNVDVAPFRAVENLFDIIFKESDVNLETITLSDVGKGVQKSIEAQKSIEGLAFSFSNGKSNTRIVYQ